MPSSEEIDAANSLAERHGLEPPVWVGHIADLGSVHSVPLEVLKAVGHKFDAEAIGIQLLPETPEPDQSP